MLIFKLVEFCFANCFLINIFLIYNVLLFYIIKIWYSYASFLFIKFMNQEKLYLQIPLLTKNILTSFYIIKKWYLIIDRSQISISSTNNSSNGMEVLNQY